MSAQKLLDAWTAFTKATKVFEEREKRLRDITMSALSWKRIEAGIIEAMERGEFKTYMQGFSLGEVEALRWLGFTVFAGKGVEEGRYCVSWDMRGGSRQLAPTPEPSRE